MNRTAALILMAACRLVDAQPWACSPENADRAEAAVDQINSWASLNHARRDFPHCDSGSIAEGYSEAVARLLVDNWDTLPEFARLGVSDPGFQRFVIRHIDSTLDTDDLRKIQQLGQTSCPARLASLCRKMVEAARRAAR